MYAQIDQFAIDKACSVIVEETFAPLYIREYYRRLGKRIWKVDKVLGDLKTRTECDLRDPFGLLWEVKNDKRAIADQVREGLSVPATGNAYIELGSLFESKADMQIRFAGIAYVIAIPRLCEAIENHPALRGGDRLKSLGVTLPLSELEEISEMAFVL